MLLIYCWYVKIATQLVVILVNKPCLLTLLRFLEILVLGHLCCLYPINLNSNAAVAV